MHDDDFGPVYDDGYPKDEPLCWENAIRELASAIRGLGETNRDLVHGLGKYCFEPLHKMRQDIGILSAAISKLNAKELPNVRPTFLSRLWSAFCRWWGKE